MSCERVRWIVGGECEVIHIAHCVSVCVSVRVLRVLFGVAGPWGRCVVEGLTVHVHENGRLQRRSPRMINCFARQPTVQILSAQGTNRNFVANNATIQRVDVRLGAHRQIITIPHYDRHGFSYCSRGEGERERERWWWCGDSHLLFTVIYTSIYGYTIARLCGKMDKNLSTTNAMNYYYYDLFLK